MNKKVVTKETVGGQGITIWKNENTSQIYNNGDYIDIVSSVTTVGVDPTFIVNTIDQQLTMPGTNVNTNLKRLIQDEISELLKKKIHFDVIHWSDDLNRPMFTCQVIFDNQVIAEKDITPDGNI